MTVKKEKTPKNKKATKSIQKVYFDSSWIKAFGRGYAGPCSWCK